MFDSTECSFFTVKEGLRTFLRVRVNLFGLPVDGDKRQQKLQRLPVPSCSNVLFVANWPVIACVPRTYNRPTATSMARQVQRLTWAVIINTYILPASASRLHAGTQQIYLKLSRLQTARKAKSITKIEIGSFSNFFETQWLNRCSDNYFNASVITMPKLSQPASRCPRKHF